MDPNENLREQRQIVECIQRWPLAIRANPDDVARLAELHVALDEWLCRGGFLPDAWARGEVDS
jgi:hypothetical protein